MKSLPIVVLAAAGFCLPLALGAAAATSPSSGPMMAQPQAAASCQKCHQATGDSISPAYPRLNAQQAAYLEAQLKAFRGHRRDDTKARTYMWIAAHNLNDKAVSDLSRYYASQKPTAPQLGGALAAEGEKLYLNGEPSKGITACQQCHGKAGEGVGAVPRIAGQHAQYLRMMLGGFQQGLRQNESMRAITKNMSDRQIEALASYLAND